MSDNVPSTPPVGMNATTDTMQPDPGLQRSTVAREPPDPIEQRRLLVGRWQQRIEKGRRLLQPTFKRMRRNMDFAYGRQWPGDRPQMEDNEESRYVANIALRHVQQRTASLYASNPTIVAKKRERMLASLWDGDQVTLAAAQAQMQQSSIISQATGQDPSQLPGAANAAAIMADVKNVEAYNKMLDRVCKTLEILYNYNVDEQTFPFKMMMKQTIRRAIVTGVGYVKLGFQRALKMHPEVERRIADMSERLAHIERLSADLADNEIPRESAEAEELRLAIAAMRQEPKLIVREGLIFDYPDTTSIIIDWKCRLLNGFLGADWVAQEYYLSVDDIQEIYGVDVGYGYRAYSKEDIDIGNFHQISPNTDTPMLPGLLPEGGDTLACVWEIYHRKDGLVYVMCDGYKDFLEEPHPPEVYNDDFWPWYPIVLNETYHDREIFPRSDMDLLKDMQLELNRARQGLREHRRANRPKMAAAAGVLEDEDKDKLRTHPANALLELNALAPGQKVEDVLMPVKMPPIDPALYETSQTFEDLLRVLGQDQSAMGNAAPDVTATESAVADASRHTDLSSVIDDQDDMLSKVAMAAGKILLLNVSAQTVQEIVGPGAVWPELTKEDVAKNIYLTVKAGSTGRPNKQQAVQNAQIIFPMLQRVPGINPEWMARELIKRLDDHIDLTEAFLAGMPSMDAMNRIQGTVATPEPQDPVNQIVASGELQPGMAGPMNVPPPLPGGLGGPMGAGPPGSPPGGVPPQGMAPRGPPGALPGRGGPPAARPGGGPSAPSGPGPGPTAPPMGGGPRDPIMQGQEGMQNAPAVPPINGRLGARMPPPPGPGGVMPGGNSRQARGPRRAIPTP